MKKIINFCLLMLVVLGLQAQSNPFPHPLAISNFKFVGFESEDQASYPTSMKGWTGDRLHGITEFPVDVQADGDEVLTLRSSSADPNALRSINNDGLAGISIRAADFNNTGERPLAVCVAVDTRGCDSITIQWTASTSIDYFTSVSGMGLQFRIGTTGNWTRFENAVYTSPVDNLVMGPYLLPDSAENQEVVQFRWVHFSQQSNDVSTNGDRIIIDSIEIKVLGTAEPSPYPLVGFEADKTNATDLSPVNFTNFTVNANTYAWDFGDGNTSDEFEPSHLYTETGTYTVKLVATNDEGTDSMVRVNYIKATALTSSVASNTNHELKVFPNPSNGKFQVSFHSSITKADVKVYNLLGKVEFAREAFDLSQKIDLSELKKGLYFINVKTSDKEFTQRISIR